MKCIKCGQEMAQDSVGKYRCPLCGQTMDDLVYREATTTTILFNPDDYKFAIHCMICGKEVVRTAQPPVSVSELIKVCDECKRAIAWAKENMKEDNNDQRRND